MRKELIRKCLQIYLRTFPPFNENGNAKLANAYRNVLSFAMCIIGGGWTNTERLIGEVIREFEQSQR